MNIKIVICFIIICFLPAASAVTTDRVWAAKTSGYLKSNESLAYENYLVGVTASDGGNTSLAIYKDQSLIAADEFRVNDFRIYNNIGITLLGIRGDYSWIALSKLEDRDIWTPMETTTLKWGDNYSIQNYSISIDALGTNTVNLTISNETMSETGIFQKDGFMDLGNLRIAVRNINRTGFVELESLTFKPPEVKAEIITDKDEYYPDETVEVIINLTSDDTQNIAGIILDSKNPITIQPDMFSISGMKGTKSFKSRITRMPPNSTIKLAAQVETRDYYNNARLLTLNKDIQITPNISIAKRIPEETDDENVPVELYVYNSGMDNKSISIHDAIPSGFTTGQQLDWNIELGSKKSTNLTYYITPQKPGKYELQPAIARWDNQSSVSKTTGTTVHMPYITMTKKAQNNGSLTDVVLVISNNGDRPAMVTLSDKIPDAHPLVFGEPAWLGLIEGGNSVSIGYSLQGNIVSLPAANATYRDIRGITRHVQLNNIETKNAVSSMGETSPINAGRNEIMVFMVSSFLVIAAIIGSVAIAAYLITKFKTRST
ncbi:MAG: hypothetical protein O8C64_01025 [Candidatus Methanoperedens sp.]|nr:hypothetical protein [Candidatus Methanoperedens sp.]MCZ7405532.1 hypothetical protein [Candidatus Methanoperedens sp.]